MRADTAALMPDWPARMGEEMAALYLGVHRDTLRARVAEGSYPAPVHEGRRVFWSKRQLDDFVAAQFGIVARKNSWD